MTCPIEVPIKSKIIITDVICSSDFYTKVQTLFAAEGYDVYFKKDPGELKKLLTSLNDSLALIIFGESFDFAEYLEFNALKQLEDDLKYVPMICFNTSHPKIKNDSTLFIDTPVLAEELVRIGIAHIKNAK